MGAKTARGSGKQAEGVIMFVYGKGEPMTREQIFQALGAYFNHDEVRWKPGKIMGSRALALCYISARAVMDRLDSVIGIGNWQTSYRESANGVVCTLSARIEGEWIVHEDFGGFSEQADDGDKHKAAFSDSLKRAAIHLNVGRYLYSIGEQWVDYDPARKWFAKVPTLPPWALPKQKSVESQVRQSSIDGWNKFIATKPKCDELNSILPEFASDLNPDEKKIVWPKLVAYAHGSGMSWLSDVKKFAVLNQPRKESA